MTKGGAVAINGERNIEFINEGSKATPTVVFKNNYGRTFGGAVYASDSELIKFTRVDFKDNYLLSGKRWVTTMGLVDYYTNWFYGYKQGTIRKTFHESLTAFTQEVETFIDLPFASNTYNNQYWYVKDEDATYKCALKSGSSTEYQWTQLDDAWTYYDETRASAARGFVEPYLFGDSGKGVYVKRGSTESIDAMFSRQTVAAYDLSKGAIGGELTNMGKGGALALMSSQDTEVIFDNCDLVDNISSYTGGALYANTEKGIIRIYGTEATRSELSGNLAGRSGGFMMIENTRASLSYVNVTKNHAEQGGAIFTFTDPDKKYKEEESELYIYKTDVVDNGFLTEDDKTPYENYTVPKENYNFSYFGTGTAEDVADKGQIKTDGHVYLDINNEARHTLYAKSDKSNWTKLMKTTASEAFNAGGAIYTYASQVKFDTGAYVAKNVNTLYSIAGSTILTRQTSNHDLNTKEEEITFEDNRGQYVFGHFSTFKAKFQFYGGKIVNNNLEEKFTSDAKYNYIDNEIQYVGNKAYEVYTARPLSTYRKSEERSIVLGGNIMIKDNKQGDMIYNLGLEEGAENRNYKFELSTVSKLHKNAEIYLTPLKGNQLTYQVFGNSQNTWEEEVEARRTAGDYDKWSNHGLWSDEWVEGIESGAVVQNIFKNDLADDPLDGRVIYTKSNKANNEPSYTPDFGQIYLENPNNLIAMKFELYDLDDEGNHRFESQLETQYFSAGSKVQSPLSDEIETMKFSTDSSIRLIDIVGYSGAGNDERFDVWNFDRYQVTKGDNTARILPGNKEINIPGDLDTYNIQTLYAINAMTNHRHKICGTPIGVPCNHPDGSTHDEDKYYFGDDGTDNLGKVGRKWAENPADKVGDNLSIEVSTLSQLMYVRQHPEYMYVLTKDLIIDSKIWNRAVNGVINDTSNPIANLKLCLNGHNIYINDDRDLAAFFGPDCYICNCQPVETKIHYTRSEEDGHNHYSASSVLTVAYKAGMTGNVSNVNIYGNEEGHIVVDELYMPTAKSNTFINLGANDKFNMAYVDFKNFGQNENSILASSLLDIPCTAYISTVSFTNIAQNLTINPKVMEHVAGQGIIRLSDADADSAVTQEFRNVKFDDISVNKQYSGIIVSYHTKETSTLTIDSTEFTNLEVAGRGAVALSQGGTQYQGNVTITNSTFSNLNPKLQSNTQGYMGGAIYAAENYGKLVIADNFFMNCGVKESDISYIKAVKGGAIYIGECTKTLKDHTENPIAIENNIFVNCIGDNGGAIYLKDVPDTNIVDNFFFQNKANVGSAIYQEFTATARRQGNVNVTRATFSENGLEAPSGGTYSSKGTYYVKMPNEAYATNLTFEDLYAVGNKGATSVIYVDKLYTNQPIPELVEPTTQMNLVLFKGTTIMTQNVGGPVMSINNSATTTNNGYVQFTDNTLIKNNLTGSSYTIYAAKACAINVQFAGIATVSENMWSDRSREANIYLSDRIQTNIIKGKKLDGVRSLLYFATDTDRPICEWEGNTIANFDAPGLFLEDHLKTDRSVTQFVIYKTDQRPYTVYIGRKTDIIEIRGFMTSTISTINKMLTKKGAKNVYMDNFTTPSDADFADLYAKQPQYRDYTFGGWIIRNSDGVYEKLTYGKTKINVDETISLDAYWTTKNHPHKSCGCAKGSTTCTHGTPDDETWVVAFRESVFDIIKDGNFLLSEDISLSRAITNPHVGYSICLNGHTLTRDYRYNLINITSAATQSGINLQNCEDVGGVQFAGSVRSPLPLISVEEVSDDADDPKILVKNVAVNNIKYGGSYAGSIINAKSADVTLDMVKVGKTEVINRAIYNFEDSDVVIKGDSLFRDEYSYNFDTSHYTGTAGLMSFTGGTVKMDNVEVSETRMTGGNGLIYFDKMRSIEVDNSRFSNNENVSPLSGAALYFRNYVTYASFSNTYFEENKTNGSGAAFNIANLSSASTIHLHDVLLRGNEAVSANSNGGAIYYANTTAGDKLTLNIYNSVIENNTAAGNTYGGGAIAFYSSDSIKETDKNEINIIYNEEKEIEGSNNGYIKGNTAVNSNGGFIYAKDTKVNIDSSAHNALVLKENIAKNYGGVIYLDKSIVQVSAERSDHRLLFTENTLTSELGQGVNIYSRGLSNEDGVSTHEDGISLKNVVATDVSGSGGDSIIAVGPYSDLRLDGSIKIGSGTYNIKGLYLFNGGVANLKMNTAKLVRKIEPGFVYNSENSKIYATTELADDVVVEGYTQNETVPLIDIFKKDIWYSDDYVVYRSGTKAYRTIHIGNKQGSVRFDIGSDATIPYKRGADVEIKTRDEMLAIIPQTIPFDSGAELDPIMNPGAEPSRPGYTFKGWVTTVFASDSKTYAINNFNFDNSQAYLPSPQTEIIVRAIWADDASGGKIDVENYDQLFWKNDANPANDVEFILHDDVVATRTDAEALAPFGRTGKTTLYMNNHEFNVYSDIQGFVDNTFKSEFAFVGYSETKAQNMISYVETAPKEHPFVVGKKVSFNNVHVRNFVMNDVFVNTSESEDTTGTTLDLQSSVFEYNERLTLMARSNQINFVDTIFAENSAKQAGSSLFPREDFPLIYLTTPSNANDGIINDCEFTENSYIYSVIMTEQSLSTFDQKLVIKDTEFKVGAAGKQEKAPQSPVLGGDYSSIIKSVHANSDTDVIGSIELDNVTFDTTYNPYYGSIIDAYETNLIIKNTHMDNMGAVLNLIKQEAFRKKAVLIATGSTFNNNTLTNKSFGQLIMRRKANDATDKFTNVTITNNKVMFALYSIDMNSANATVPSYEFAGNITIKNNRFNLSTNASGDIYIPHFDDLTDKDDVIKFSTTMPISSTSEIAFYRPTAITNGSLIAYNSWVPAAHDHATERIFTMIDSGRNTNYVIYRDGNSLKVSRNNAMDVFTTIQFDLNGEDISNPADVVTEQYIADGTYVDEPADPVSAAGREFLGWYVVDKDTPNKYIRYNFASDADDYKLYDATRSVVYAKWNKEIKLSVWGNSGGHPVSDPTK
ncbi:MAG: InlB B-repeat-containing protein, partial [Lachnospiraceae bacterium]|nr:InlB B-repeat-containing protein [Lachnospiraceae bacterium]